MPSIRDIIRGKARLGKRTKRAFVCVDAANYRKYLSENNIRLDWYEFKCLIESMYKRVQLVYYDGTITRSWYRHMYRKSTDEEFRSAKKNQESFFKKLPQFGYKIVTKPIEKIYQAETGDYKYKCNFDVEITMDVFENLSDFDVLVLCSGDGDFINLVKRLKRKYLKEVHAIAVEGRFNSKLKETVTSYDYLNNLLVYVQKLKQ
jgi:uncharacterized LabA/DUF88 family protein